MPRRGLYALGVRIWAESGSAWLQVLEERVAPADQGACAAGPAVDAYLCRLPAAQLPAVEWWNSTRKSAMRSTM